MSQETSMLLPIPTGENPAPARGDPRPLASAVPVDELHAGRCGAIVRVQADPSDVNRLAGMGICVGRQVQLVKRGDPMILRVYGTRIGLSSRLGRGIHVVPCTAVCRGEEP